MPAYSTVPVSTDPVAAGRGHITTAHLQTLTNLVAVDSSRSPLEVTLPATGEVLGAVRRGRPSDVEEAARQARTAQAAWAMTPVEDRAAVFTRFAKLLLARQAEILDLIQLENSKARRDAFTEVMDVVMNCTYYAREAPKLLRTKRCQSVAPLLAQTVVTHTPKGLVTVIAPWNYPLTLGIGDAIPALIAGNAVLVKPDQQTPFSTLWAAELLAEAGLPPHVFTVVTGSGSELGRALVEASDFLMFTGSTAVGRKLAAQAGERLIECSMELGGKNACLVLDDAPLTRTVDGVINACFSNTGQLCISMERIYVDAAIWDRFVPALIKRTKALALGHRLDYSVDCGPLISERQLQTTSFHVADAVEKGATVLAGGLARPDLGPTFFEPTLLTDVPPEALLRAEETFGPVASLYRVEGVEEAISRANNSHYGLNFSVWTGNPRRGREIATQLHAGTVTVNDGFAATWGSTDAPMGGWKDSGLGTRHGAHGLLKYTDARNITVQRFAAVNRPPRGVSFNLFAKLMSAVIRHIPRLPRL